MPSQIQVALYEVGLRIRQALEAYPAPDSDDASLSDAFRKGTIHRLAAALERLESDEGAVAAIGQQGLQIVREVYAVLRTRSESRYGEVNVHLASLRDMLHTRFRITGPLSKDDSSWLQLGLEIADGRGEERSEGRPTIRDHRLEFVGPRPATWFWRNPTRVQRLLGGLGEDGDNLLPASDSLAQEDWDRFPGLPACMWNWCSLEKGLLRLRGRAEQAAADAPRPRRRGRRRDPTRPHRDQLIRAARRAYPDLTHRELAGHLGTQYPDLRFTKNIVRNALRES